MILDEEGFRGEEKKDDMEEEKDDVEEALSPVDLSASTFGLLRTFQ